MVRWPEPSVAPGSVPSREDESWQYRLCELHAPALRGYLAQWTRGERSTTEALVRETLRRAAVVVDHGRVAAHEVRPWLLTLARRVALDANLSRSRPPAGPARPDGNAVTTARAVSDAQVVVALKSVPAEHRAVIVELFHRRRSVVETAVLLAVDEATVQYRAYHGLQALRSAIASTTHQGASSRVDAAEA